MHEDRTPEQIQAEILADLQTDLQRREGSFAADLASAVGVSNHKVYSALDAVRYMVWVDETSGSYLDLAAEDMGIEPRKAGTRAQVALRFTGAEGYRISTGDIFATVDGLEFAALEDEILDETGEATGGAEARQVGTACNVAAGAICCAYTNDSRLSAVTNPEPATGGTDPESDASLYARLAAARKRPASSGNKAHYEEWAREVDGVDAAVTFPLHKGNGTVGVMIADENFRPVDEVVVRNCQTHIEGKMPIGPTLEVWSARAVEVDVAASVSLLPGADGNAVREGFVSALDGYLREVAQNRYRQEEAEYQVRLNKIGALLMSLEGVRDYTALALNDREASLELQQDEVPIPGELVLIWA